MLRLEYDVVNDATIWRAATIDLLPLEVALEALLRDVESGRAT